MVEVDASNLVQINNFNYILELVEEKPKQDILGLPLSAKGYEEVKPFLKRLIKVCKALIQELED